MDSSRLKDLAVNEAGFVFDPVTGHSYHVNQTALAVLRGLQVGLAPDAIVDVIRRDFEVDRDDDLARDVDEFIARLREQRLMR